MAKKRNQKRKRKTEQTKERNRTMQRREFLRRAHSGHRVPMSVEDHGRRFVYTGNDFVDDGRPRGDETKVVD